MVRVRVIERKSGEIESIKLFESFPKAALWWNGNIHKNNLNYHMKIEEIPGSLNIHRLKVVWSWRYYAVPVAIALGLIIYIAKAKHV